MRAGCLLLLISFAGISAAQDTNFSVGPQYLITTDSTLLLRPIATPSMSLQPLPSPSAPAVETEPQNGIEPTAQSASIAAEPFLATVYWGKEWVDHILGVEEPASVIEISSAEPLANLPQSLFDSGVAGLNDAESLRERGYGLPLGDTASFWKTHGPRATRVFTNEDVKRLHGG